MATNKYPGVPGGALHEGAKARANAQRKVPVRKINDASYRLGRAQEKMALSSTGQEMSRNLREYHKATPDPSLNQPNAHRMPPIPEKNPMRVPENRNPAMATIDPLKASQDRKLAAAQSKPAKTRTPRATSLATHTTGGTRLPEPTAKSGLSEDTISNMIDTAVSGKSRTRTPRAAKVAAPKVAPKTVTPPATEAPPKTTSKARTPNPERAAAREKKAALDARAAAATIRTGGKHPSVDLTGASDALPVAPERKYSPLRESRNDIVNAISNKRTPGGSVVTGPRNHSTVHPVDTSRSSPASVPSERPRDMPVHEVPQSHGRLPNGYHVYSQGEHTYAVHPEHAETANMVAASHAGSPEGFHSKITSIPGTRVGSRAAWEASRGPSLVNSSTPVSSRRDKLAAARAESSGEAASGPITESKKPAGKARKVAGAIGKAAVFTGKAIAADMKVGVQVAKVAKGEVNYKAEEALQKHYGSSEDYRPKKAAPKPPRDPNAEKSDPRIGHIFTLGDTGHSPGSYPKSTTKPQPKASAPSAPGNPGKAPSVPMPKLQPHQFGGKKDTGYKPNNWDDSEEMHEW